MKTATEKENTMKPVSEFYLAGYAKGLINRIEDPTADQLADALADAVAALRAAGLLDGNSADLVARAQTILGI